MGLFTRITRSVGRTNLIGIVICITVLILFISFYETQKRKEQQLNSVADAAVEQKVLPRASKISKKDNTATRSLTEEKTTPIPEIKTKIDSEEKSSINEEEKSIKTNDDFAHYASDKHLLSLLRKQANSQGEVIATIIGGDSYSLFAWDWHQRMSEISNDTNNCHCFVIAMDEIGVILSKQQNVPVYLSTFSFETQMQWTNNIEARQHSLYRVGHAKFDTTARVVRMGYSIMLSEMDVFWRMNPLDYLKQPINSYDLQISHHYGSHPRVNIGLFFVRPSNASKLFFSFVAEFWIRYGKGGYLADQRVLDALLNNYDKLDKTYLRAMKPLALTFNWTTNDFGNHFSHLMTDGSAFILFSQAAKFGIRSKKFYGDSTTKFFTVTITNVNMSVSERNLLIRSLLILQHTTLKNRIFILPAFTTNLTIVPITYQLDIKKFLLYWKEDRVRLPDFFLLSKTEKIPVTTHPYSSKKNYDDINGILNFTIESIPLDLPAPSPQFEVHIRDSLLWCSPPMVGGGWCIHHPRDFGVTMEILFACRGDPYPPCANKTALNEQFLQRPYENQ